jgi:hypothetical protein
VPLDGQHIPRKEPKDQHECRECEQEQWMHDEPPMIYVGCKGYRDGWFTVPKRLALM